MIIELFLALLAGILAGTFTGLIPGIHTNLIAIFILSISFLTNLPPLVLIVFITALAITHTFVDFIPSIFLGAPDEDTALAIMPGHQLLLKGQGHEAVLLTLIGSASAIFLLIFIIPTFILIIPKIYPFINQMMGFILIWTVIFLVSRETNSKFWAILIFILSGFLGLATLNLTNINQPLLPLLTGLFGSSTLIYSISQKFVIPKQKIGKLLLIKKQLIKPMIATTLVSPLCSFLPGLGSSQAAIIGNEIFPKKHKLNNKQFLILLGSINTLVVAMSFATLYIINKSRTGVAAAIQQISQITLKELTYILITIIITAIIATFITLKISKFFAKNIHRVNYSKISIGVLIFLSIIILLFTQLTGFLVFLVATLVGLTCIYAGVRRGFLMGSLLIPTILFYLPFF